MPAAHPAPLEAPGCDSAEVFALAVVGQSMAPEFNDGEVIIIEPEGLARDGSYVVARHQGDWLFRQLIGHDGAWWLHPLNPAWPDLPLASLADVRGVVIQKAVPGRRRASRRYV